MIAIADIRYTKTGEEVCVPVEGRTELSLLKQFPYWRAYFFRVGQGLQMEQISEKALKSAKQGDYAITVRNRGRVVWEG